MYLHNMFLHWKITVKDLSLLPFVWTSGRTKTNSIWGKARLKDEVKETMSADKLGSKVKRVNPVTDV